MHECKAERVGGFERRIGSRTKKREVEKEMTDVEERRSKMKWEELRWKRPEK